MAKNSGQLEEDLNDLFKLPLAEFTGARNTLAAQLKQSGRANDASLVKALAKPSISAWAVNQLYWNHRDEYESLLAAASRFRKAQTSGGAGKVADMRRALDGRRDALSRLSDLVASLLRDAGHNPTSDTMLRITRTLEAISAQASISDGPTPGRLTKDVDPPGFESLGSFVPTAGTTERIQKSQPSRKDTSAATSTRQKATPARDEAKPEETRRVRIAAAKVSLQEAKRVLTEVRTKAQRLEVAQKKAQADAKEAEKERRDAEQRFKTASAESKKASEQAGSIADEAKEAAKALEDAKRTLEKATKELESLFRESPGM